MLCNEIESLLLPFQQHLPHSSSSSVQEKTTTTHPFTCDCQRDEVENVFHYTCFQPTWKSQDSDQHDIGKVDGCEWTSGTPEGHFHSQGHAFLHSATCGQPFLFGTIPLAKTPASEAILQQPTGEDNSSGSPTMVQQQAEAVVAVQSFCMYYNNHTATIHRPHHHHHPHPDERHLKKKKEPKEEKEIEDLNEEEEEEVVEPRWGEELREFCISWTTRINTTTSTTSTTVDDNDETKEEEEEEEEDQVSLLSFSPPASNSTTLPTCKAIYNEELCSLCSSCHTTGGEVLGGEGGGGGGGAGGNHQDGMGLNFDCGNMQPGLSTHDQCWHPPTTGEEQQQQESSSLLLLFANGNLANKIHHWSFVSNDNNLDDKELPKDDNNADKTNHLTGSEDEVCTSLEDLSSVPIECHDCSRVGHNDVLAQCKTVPKNESKKGADGEENGSKEIDKDDRATIVSSSVVVEDGELRSIMACHDVSIPPSFSADGLAWDNTESLLFCMNLPVCIHGLFSRVLCETPSASLAGRPCPSSFCNTSSITSSKHGDRNFFIGVSVDCSKALHDEFIMMRNDTSINSNQQQHDIARENPSTAFSFCLPVTVETAFGFHLDSSSFFSSSALQPQQQREGTGQGAMPAMLISAVFFVVVLLGSYLLLIYFRRRQQQRGGHPTARSTTRIEYCWGRSLERDIGNKNNATNFHHDHHRGSYGMVPGVAEILWNRRFCQYMTRWQEREIWWLYW